MGWPYFSLTKQEARKAFRLPQSATLVLLSFGGLGLERLPWSNLKQLGDFFFVTTGETKQETNNLRVLPEAQRNYEDLVRAVDVVVTKPGYGIVADVISHQVRTLYTERGEFAEYPHLTRALDECATAEFIPQDQLLSGNLAPYLTRLLNKKKAGPPCPRRCSNSGSEDFGVDQSLNAYHKVWVSSIDRPASIYQT